MLARTLSLVAMVAAAVLASCGGPGGDARGGAGARTSLWDPLARIPVRQDAIIDAAAREPVDRDGITREANETKEDAGDAGSAARALVAEIEALKAELAQSRSAAHLEYQRTLGNDKRLCALVIGVAVFACMFLGVKALIGAAAAGSVLVVLMLVGVADEFVHTYAPWIIGGILAVVLPAFAYVVWRAVPRIVASADRMLAERAGAMTPVLKAEVRALQGGLVSRLVHWAKGRAAALQATAASARAGAGGVP